MKKILAILLSVCIFFSGFSVLSLAAETIGANTGDGWYNTVAAVKQSGDDIPSIDDADTVLDIVAKTRGLGLKRLFSFLIELLRHLCAYVLDYVYFPFDWDKTIADQKVEQQLRDYCAEHDCVVTEIYRVDKDFFVPNSQTYFSDGEPVGDGVCGVASWEMILGGYRDKGVLSALPDDKTMYREIMEIMDEITAELQPKIAGLLKNISPLLEDYVNPFLIENTGTYIDPDFNFNSYEVIGTLDVGIAMYLQKYGYTEQAKRVLSNITIGIPVLTPAKRSLFLREVKNEIAEWLYAKTDGKLNIPTGLGSSTQDTVLRSLQRGEPAVIGCWMSLLGDDDLTNHYFVATSLYKVKSVVKLTDRSSIVVERNLVEIYDTWSNRSVELIDFDSLANTTISDANSLARLF